MVVPRDGGIWTDYAYAASHVLNGNGEMTGLAWAQESGMLGSPIGITNTYQVGLVRNFLAAESVRVGVTQDFLLPVVGETDDGWLSDAEAFRRLRRMRPRPWPRRVEGPWSRAVLAVEPG